MDNNAALCSRYDNTNRRPFMCRYFWRDSTHDALTEGVPTYNICHIARTTYAHDSLSKEKDIFQRSKSMRDSRRDAIEQFTKYGPTPSCPDFAKYGITRMRARMICVVMSPDKKIYTPREIRITPDDDKSLSNSCAMDK